ncbi:MAG: 50S ribosomal protein L3 [Actinomycetota bacterium]|nr:50S ribosomal protein L3 [Actinomycetota bacterium]
MMRGILGKKLGMTQIFKENKAVPVTVVEAGPCVVTQVKTKEKDGYSAIQIGFDEIKEKHLNAPLKGHFARAKVSPQKYLAEVTIAEGEDYKVGQVLTVDIFSEGERIDVTGISKGKGFAGVMKRWGFKGGPASHGSRFHRAPGSIGACADPSRVFKGKKMPGHMGNERVTVQNLEVAKVDPDQNLLLLRGSIPGAVGSLVIIKESVKAKGKSAKRGKHA